MYGLVLREGPAKMETRDESSESSGQLGPVGEKRANRFALRSLPRIQAMRACHRIRSELPALFAVSLRTRLFLSWSTAEERKHCLSDGWRTVSADCLVADTRLWRPGSN